MLETRRSLAGSNAAIPGKGRIQDNLFRTPKHEPDAESLLIALYLMRICNNCVGSFPIMTRL